MAVRPFQPARLTNRIREDVTACRVVPRRYRGLPLPGKGLPRPATLSARNTGVQFPFTRWAIAVVSFRVVGRA
jgi:hypothetical protein